MPKNKVLHRIGGLAIRKEWYQSGDDLTGLMPHKQLHFLITLPNITNNPTPFPPKIRHFALPKAQHKCHF